MLRTRFDQLVHDAKHHGQLVSCRQESLPFSPGETEVTEYNIENYRVTFHDGNFNSMFDLSSNKYVDTQNLSDVVDVSELDDETLTKLAEQAGQELRVRHEAARKDAILAFVNAWTAIRADFPDTELKLTVRNDDLGKIAVQDIKIST